MSHANYILLQSKVLEMDSIINKFSRLIDNVLAQLKEEKLHKSVASIIKCIPEEDKLGLISGLIQSKCQSLNVYDESTDENTDNCNSKVLSLLSLNEQFYVLAHANLDLVRPKVEVPNSIFVDLVYTIIRDRLPNL